MRGLIFGTLAFTLSLASYALIVRCWRPPASTRLLAPVLFVGSSLIVVALAVLDHSPGVIDDALLAIILSLSFALAYLVANTAIETDSPTQSLILFLAEHRSTGVTEEMLERFIIERPFRDSRLEGLIKDGLVERHGDRLICRSSGRAFLDVLDAYRQIIGRGSITG